MLLLPQPYLLTILTFWDENSNSSQMDFTDYKTIFKLCQRHFKSEKMKLTLTNFLEQYFGFLANKSSIFTSQSGINRAFSVSKGIPFVHPCRNVKLSFWSDLMTILFCKCYFIKKERDGSTIKNGDKTQSQAVRKIIDTIAPNLIPK